MRNQKETEDLLMDFSKKVGTPVEKVINHASLLLGKDSEFQKAACFLHIQQSFCEPHTQKQNVFEGETRLLKQ